MRSIGIRCAALPAALALFGATSVLAQVDQTQPGQQQEQQRQQQQEQQRLQQQRQQQQQQQQMGQQAQREVDLIRGSELLDKPVQNAEGERLGTIEEIVADVSNGRVAYAVLSFGGILGMGEELYAIPWEALKNVDEDAEFVVLDIPREHLEQAEGFDADTWPDMGDQRFLERTYQHYEIEPYEQTRQRRMQRIQPQEERGIAPDAQRGMERPGAEQEAQQQQQQQQQQQRLQQPQGAQQQGAQQLGQREAEQEVQLERRNFWVNRTSDLIGLSVEDPQGEDLGTLRDVVIDTREGRIVYGVVGHGGVLGIGESYAAVPWRELDIRPAREAFVLDANQQILERISFEPGEWPDMQDQQWALRVHQEFDAEPYWQVFGYPAPGEDRPGAQQQQPGQQQQDSGWSPQSRYNQQFDAQRVQEITGTIIQVGTFRPQQGDAEGVALQIRDQQGQVHIVHLAPRAYMDRQQIQLQANQQVELRAAPAQINGQQVYLAQQIEAQDKTVQLRDQQGRPQWTQADLQQRGLQQQGMQQRQQPGQQQQDSGWSHQSRYNQQFDAQRLQNITGTITQVGTFRPQQGDAEGVALQIRDQQGQTHTVHLAPRAYMDRQQIQLQPNQQVELRAAPAQFNGQQVYLAQQIEAGDETVQLRDQQGRPQWTQADLQQQGAQQRQQPGQQQPIR